jgi:hypothetical protein
MRQISNSTTTVSPVGGMNTYDAIPAMPVQDAILLRNFLPSSYGVSIRKGYRNHADGFTGIVKTLMTWRNTDGTNAFFAVDDDGIYDVSTPDTVTGTPDVDLTDARIQWTVMGNSAGVHLIGFNGVDDGVWYTDAGWDSLESGNGTDSGTWANVDPADLIHCTVHQKRVWAVQKDSTLGWYLPPEQIYGVASSFDFGGVFNRGGYLQALTTWTHDGGDGMDDYLLAISSAGQVAVYKGLSPDSVATWECVGTYFVGETFTRRCFAKYGGDVVLLTQYGVLTMSGIVKSSDGSVLTTALSRKIQSLFSQVTTEGSYRDGWQILVYPSANLLIVNVPGLDITQNTQLVLNTIIGSWTTFSEIEAFCWATDYDSLFFGGDAVVHRAWEGFQDNVAQDGSGGDDILASAQQAFNYFGLPGQLKHFKMVRPTFIVNGEFEYQIGINVDFNFNDTEAPGGMGIENAGIWGTSEWGDGSVWTGGYHSSKQWSSVLDFGYAASVRLSMKANSEITWTSVDWIFEKGGIV